jgi:hypothetical protein
MKAKGNTVEEILHNIPAERKVVFIKLHKLICKNLPKGFEPAISYGGLGYVVPHRLYPKGYHCKPTEPLPFAGLASQKNGIHLYHMGIYSKPEILKWLLAEYPKFTKQKLDIGKSCIRFKKVDDIPFQLIAELMQKITVKEWIQIYEKEIKKG